MNKTAQALLIVGWLIIILGFIGSFWLADYSAVACIAGIISSIVLGLFFIAMAEIIKILDDNRTYLKNMANLTPQTPADTKDELPDL